MNQKADDQATDNDETLVLDDENAGSAGAGDDEAQNLDDAGTDDAGSDDAGQKDEGDDESVVVTIGEDAPPPDDDAQHAPEWVRELRKANREDKRRIRELEDKLKAATGAETKPAPLGKKPTLEDHDYDAERFEAALENWYEQKRRHDEEEAKAQAAAKAEQEAWQAKLDSYGKAKTELKVRDFEDAEQVAQETLNATQQGIILQGSENPALVIYALGKNPKKAKELAAITDPVKYAFAVAKLETQLKVTQRKAPPPEKTIQGNGRISGSVDSTLERLREEASRTGDYTKVHQYRSAQRKKSN